MSRIHNEKRTVSSIHGAGKTRQISRCKRMKLEPYVIYIINSKWIKELNIRPEKVKLLEESIGKISLISVLAVTFLIQQQKHKNKSKNKQVDYIK